jgi:hypothetical protein
MYLLSKWDVPQEYWGMLKGLYGLSLNQIADEKFFLESGVHINAYQIMYENEPHWVAIEPCGYANIFTIEDYENWKEFNMAEPFMDF